MDLLFIPVGRLFFLNKLNCDLGANSPQMHLEVEYMSNYLVTSNVAECLFVIDTFYISSPAELWLLIQCNFNLCRLWLTRRASFVDTLSGISEIAQPDSTALHLITCSPQLSGGDSISQMYSDQFKWS